MANESAGQSASRKQLIIIGALFVVLLGIVYFMFLRGGEEDASTEAAPPPAAPVTAPDPAEDDEEAVVPETKGKGPVETSDVLAGKDPFEAVLDLTPDTGGGEATATETTTPTDEGTTTPPVDGTTTPPDDGTTTPPPVVTPPPDDDGDNDEPQTGYTVRLLTVYKDDGVEKAIVGVTNRQTDKRKTYKNLVEGERFATRFKLTSMQKKCAEFLYGDEPFALCEGQRITHK